MFWVFIDLSNVVLYFQMSSSHGQTAQHVVNVEVKQKPLEVENLFQTSDYGVQVLLNVTGVLHARNLIDFQDTIIPKNY